MHALFQVSDSIALSRIVSGDADLLAGCDILVIDLVGMTAAGDAPGLGDVCDLIRAAKRQTPRPRLFVRIPLLDDTSAIATLDAAVGAGAEGIVLPGTQGGHDVTRLDARISVEEAVHGIDHGGIKIIAEAADTAKAAQGLASFRGASHRLIGLIWSPDRLASNLGGISVRTHGGALRDPLAVAQGQFLLAAYAAGVTAIVDYVTKWPDIAPRDRYVAAQGDGFDAVVTADMHELGWLASVMSRPRGELTQCDV